MHRHSLLTLLAAFRPTDDRVAAMHRQTIAFVEAHPACFERHLTVGHVTGSALIVSPDRQQVVLIHHRKLDRWFQPGGHCDGDPDVAAVARREAEEETGLTSLKLLHTGIFDLDVHPIPARGTEPAHLHYDIRFLFEGHPDEPFRATPETRDIRWVPCTDVHRYTESESVLRMISNLLLI